MSTNEEIEGFLAEPRLAILMYHGHRPAPTGVPVWFDWRGGQVQMFAARNSPKVRHLTANPQASVLVTNRVGEPEAWVAFDGTVQISDFAEPAWHELLDRVAPRYWDLSDDGYAEQIAAWRSAPAAFVSLTMRPDRVRSGS